MTIKFYDVDLLLEDPGGVAARHVRRYLEWPNAFINPPVGATDNKSRVLRPSWPRQPRLRPNQLYWPSGATRWAQFIGLATTVAKDAILAKLASRTSSATLTLSLPLAPNVNVESGNDLDDDFNLQADVAPTMWMLSPMPVTTSDTFGASEPAPPDRSLWILPFVDKRYWWQQIQLFLTSETWDELFDEIANGLSITIQRDTEDDIDEDYGVPDPCFFRNGPINAAVALDLACWATNHRFVTLGAQNSYAIRRAGVTPPDMYQLQRDAQQDTAGSGDSSAGGESSSNRDGDVPKNIRFLFNNDLPEEGYVADQDIADAPEWAAGQDLELVCPANWTESNDSELDAIADRWSEDFWTWSEWRFTWSWNRLLNWRLTGFEDYILIDLSRRRGRMGRDGEYNARTFVKSLPPLAFGWNVVPVQLAAYGDRDCAGSEASVGHGGCGCCDPLDCQPAEQATVSVCDACPNQGSYRYMIDIGPWAPWPDVRQSFLDYTGSGCTWETTIPHGVGISLYKWVLIIAGVDGEDTTLELVHVSGPDVIGVNDNPMVYKASGNFSCRCVSRLEAFQAENFPGPNLDGLHSAVCVMPIGLPCACCLALDVCNFTGDNAHLNSPYVLNGLVNCDSPSESSDDECYFNPDSAECCDGDPETFPAGCWRLYYNRDSRLVEIRHPDIADPGQNPNYRAILDPDENLCDGGTYAIGWNYSDFPDGPPMRGGEQYPEAISVTAVACDGSDVPYGCGPTGCNGQGCRYVADVGYWNEEYPGIPDDPYGPWTWTLLGAQGHDPPAAGCGGTSCSCAPPPDTPPASYDDEAFVDCVPP